MLTIRNGAQKSRRRFLQCGALGLGGLTLADLLRTTATAEGTGPSAERDRAAARPKSLIYIVLSGGPSHIDMHDLKPNAPSEIRGPFAPIATSLPGEFLCEHMPHQAQWLDRCALVRGICSVENDHYLAEVYSGLPRSAGQRPAFGSAFSRLGGAAGPMPPYVSLAHPQGIFEYELPHYAGPGHAPFRPDEQVVDNLKPVESLERLADRRRLLAAFDGLTRQADRIAQYGGLDRHQEQALSIVTSSAVRDAFDLSKEPPGTLERYGHKQGGFTHQTVKEIVYPWSAKDFVMARRLIEAGVRIVTLQVGSWDHHGGPTTDIFLSLKMMLPSLDRSLCALLADLRDRGLSDDVAVVMLGEFGRTPKISPGPGREHWAEAGCALFHGGGLKMGQVIGATDPIAARSVDGRIGFQNVMATLYRVLGVDPERQLVDHNGRPKSLLDDPQPILALTG